MPLCSAEFGGDRMSWSKLKASWFKPLVRTTVIAEDHILSLPHF